MISLCKRTVSPHDNRTWSSENPPFIFSPEFINAGRKGTFCGAVGANLSLCGDQPESAHVKLLLLL